MFSRPISEAIIQYCVSDVQYLPELKDVYWGELDDDWKHTALDESKRRVAIAEAVTSPRVLEQFFPPV